MCRKGKYSRCERRREERGKQEMTGDERREIGRKDMKERRE